MIYCPQCGTPNKPNSKFCKNCAALLQPSTDIRCPICGTMNPQDAEACKSCGTRLKTSAAGASASDQTTLTHSPENIAPFNPPELTQESDEPASKASPSATRAAFSQSNSQRLRRLGKTAPTETTPPAAPSIETSSADTAESAPASTAPAPDDWLKQLDANPPVVASSAPPAKPQLGEIKLTGDDYDYSDIGGEVTAEMKAQLEAEAGGAQSVEDEVALAMRLLGLSPTGEPLAQAAPLETVEPVASAPEIIATETIAPEPVAPIAEIETPASSEPPIIVANATEIVAAETIAPEPVASIAEIETPASSEPPIIVASATETITTEAVTQTEASESENAEWLANLAASSSTAVAAKITPDERAGTPESETARLPEQEPSAQTPIAETSKALPPAIADTSHLPEWLRAMAPPDEPDDAAADAAEEMPGWIQDLAPDERVVGATGVLSQLPDLDESERQDLPDWLREPLEPAEPLASDKIAEPSQAESQFEFDKEPTESDAAPKPSVELPLWMRDDAAAGRDPFELVETSGPLAGVSGVLPLALALTEPHTLSTTPPPRADSGRIFQTLLAEPLAAATSAPPVTQTGRKFSSKHVIYLIIALAALLALFLPAGGDELGLLGKNVVSSPSAVFYDQLNALPAASAALMAFEYTPGQVPELDPAARAILEILATRQIKVVALSSNPNGAILAQRLLEETQRAHPDFIFTNLGYIPGNEAGLKRLALGWLPSDYRDADGAAWSQSPLASQVRGMDDFAQAILMLGDSNGLNGWMTQVQPVIKTPILAATTVALEPQARIYVNSKQLAASLRGLTGAAELELWSGNSGRAVKTVNALSFVGLALAGIIIIANIMWLLKRGKK